MQECESVRELLWAYCDGSLEAEARERVARHLAGCAACAREHRRAAATLHALGNLERIEPAGAFLDRLWRRIDEREAARGLGRLLPVLAWIRANRSVVVAGALAFFIALVGVRYGLDGVRGHGEPGVDVAGEGASGAPLRPAPDGGYRDDYILRGIPETLPVAEGFGLRAGDSIETRFMTRDLVPPVPYSNDYIQPVVQPVAGDGDAF